MVQTIVKINKSVPYHILAKACYKLNAEYSISLNETDSEHILIVTPLKSTSINFNEELSREIIDHTVRESLENQFGNIRDLIYTYAFSTMEKSEKKKS